MNFNITLDLPKEKNIYRLVTGSGSGKTYLGALLRRYGDAGERMTSYTYSDYKRGLPISSVLNPGKYDYVMLDRYDLYYGLGAGELHTVKGKMTVIMDCKRSIDFIRVKLCGVYIERDRVVLCT